MKKEYLEPSMEIVYFGKADILTDSAGTGEWDGDFGDDSWS